MAIQASTQWWIRADGNALNGGGYDSGISGAGTNFSDQSAPQLSLSDFATSGAGSTTLTSATGGFTSSMIGNCVRIASGTNFTAGYYFVTGHTNTNTVTLDRSPTPSGAGSGGVGRLGGAFASIGQFSTGGSLGTPPITSPLAPGHRVNIRGNGSDEPSSADYTYTGGYYQFAAGAPTGNGVVSWVGYNGRPRIHHGGLLYHSIEHHYFENLMVVQTASDFVNAGFTNGSALLNNMIADQNGLDATQFTATAATDVWLRNTGGGAAGSQPIIKTSTYDGQFTGILIENARGIGLTCDPSTYPTIRSCIIRGCGSHGLRVAGAVSNGLYAALLNNTIYDNGGDGIRIEMRPTIRVENNLLVDNGGYGINVTSNFGGTNNGPYRVWPPQHNAFQNNSSGKYNNYSGEGDIDLTADPFVNAAGGDLGLNNAAGGGALLRGSGYPASFRGLPATASYFDVGAVQHEDSGGGGGTVTAFRTIPAIPRHRRVVY